MVSLPTRRLEAGMQPDEEGMIRGNLKHMLLCLDPIDILKK